MFASLKAVCIDASQDSLLKTLNNVRAAIAVVVVQRYINEML